MFIAVDQEEMKFIYKHPELSVVMNLMWIEYPRGSTSVDLYAFDLHDSSGLQGFTDMELAILYRNTTGFDHSGLNRNALLQVLFNLAEAIPVKDINPYELEYQADFIKGDDYHNYQFVGGSIRPAKINDLFEVTPLHASSNPGQETKAQNGETPAVLRRTGRDRAGVNRVATSQKPASVLSPSLAPPRRGSAKVIIWEVADAMWAEAGSPTDKETILQLRRNIMLTLEGKGIKKTTSSSQLGNWHKTRAPF